MLNATRLSTHAEVGQVQVAQASNEQPRADEEEHRQHHLRYDERLTKAQPASAADDGADLILQCWRKVWPCRSEGRNEAEQDTGRQCERKI